MTRLQVYLGASELELLYRVAGLTGASRSTLVRRAGRDSSAEGLRHDAVSSRPVLVALITGDAVSFVVGGAGPSVTAGRPRVPGAA